MFSIIDSGFTKNVHTHCGNLCLAHDYAVERFLINMKHITIKDVASLAGVSISTVSRYLSDPTRIRPALASAVRKSIKELNYIPNPFAQNLKSEYTNIIAVITPDISNQFFSEACKALCNIFYKNKYFVVICDTDDDPEKEKYYINEMIRSRAAGVMLVTCGQNTEFIQNVVDAGHRLILFDRMEQNVKVDAVCEDNFRAGYDLTKYLLSCGHRSFAALSGSEKSINMQLINSGIQKALEEAGVVFENKYNFMNIKTKEEAASTFESLLTYSDCPKCIIACNSNLLDGVVLAANRMRLSIPEKYAIAGFSVNDPRYTYPFPVPAIMENPALVGYEAGELMLKYLADKSKLQTPKLILLDAKLVLPEK